MGFTRDDRGGEDIGRLIEAMSFRREEGAMSGDEFVDKEKYLCIVCR